jgi:ribosomal protein L12E/L44/L45/RPP1/RPP2
LAEYLISSASADVKNALEANGIDADDERLDRLLEEAEGKDINELIGDISNTV